jgi:anti-sigma factor RsiW
MNTMDCSSVRTQLLSLRRGLLPAAQAELIEAHLAGCDACRHADAADAELTRALRRLPPAPASDTLRRQLEKRWLPAQQPSADQPPQRPPTSRLALALGSFAAAIALAAGVLLFVRSDRSDALFAEAVNDHLRVLYSQHPIEIESGGIHQVKPWFAGKLDFAPAVTFAGDDEFPLKGGAVAVFMERKAAAFVFSRRLHTITLFVFPADGLPWPATGGASLGSARVYAHTARGFHALLWRTADLGYAAVSDVSESELSDFAARVVAAR